MQGPGWDDGEKAQQALSQHRLAVTNTWLRGTDPASTHHPREKGTHARLTWLTASVKEPIPAIENDSVSSNDETKKQQNQHPELKEFNQI